MNAQIESKIHSNSKFIEPISEKNQVSTLENIYWADMSVYYTKILKLK